ncbi:hypothetical protein RhiirA5_403995 [Rhizophagus irregularis]|uniref:Uncharacterized protein n=1 Tax=Rhizophagus irregularis TaxID=588596 RepID=A0A2N0NUQ1_9GLOM|nr:hypothetical protein RhiirA5_403995 [Rhizophagus irregularis]
MHHLDLGLFRYQIIFTCDILKLQHVNGNKLVEEVDRRLAAIPRFPAIKIFSNGLQSIARLTANEYRSLMKVMIFVIDNLYDENNNEVDNFVNNDDLAKLYEYWNEMYILSRYEEFSESDLEKFNDAIHRWTRMFVKAFKFVSPSNLKLSKLHSWVYHIIDSIRSYGTINGYITETYESLHKYFVKIPYRIHRSKGHHCPKFKKCKFPIFLKNGGKLWKMLHYVEQFFGIALLHIGRNRTIRPKFDQVEYRLNDDLTCVKLRSNFQTHLRCQSSQIRKGYSAKIRLKFGKDIWLKLDLY